MPYLYILECADGSYYVGSTWDAELRLAQHNAGEGAKYTRRRRPVRFAYVEWFERIDEAYAAEKQVQGWGRRKRQMLIEGRAHDLPGSGSRSRSARDGWAAGARSSSSRTGFVGIVGTTGAAEPLPPAVS